MKKTTILAGSLLLCLTVVSVVSAETLMEESLVPVAMQTDDGKADKDYIDKDCISDCSSEPLWTFRAGIVALKRESPIKEIGPISYKVFDFDYEAGLDVGAIRRWGDCHAIEFRYFGIDEWSDGLNFGPVEAGYLSRLHSTELNLRRQLGERLDVLAGFRWVEMHEETAVILDGQTPLWAANVDNHMYGFQIGGQAKIWDRGGPLQVTSGVKAGIYYNDADATGSILMIPGAVEETHTSFLGEFDVVGRLALTDNLALRAGYQLMWLEGVAGAGGQVVSAISGNNVDTASSPFYHGAILGVELTR